MWGNYIYLRKMIVKGRDNPEQFKFSKQNKPPQTGFDAKGTSPPANDRGPAPVPSSSNESKQQQGERPLASKPILAGVHLVSGPEPDPQGRRERHGLQEKRKERREPHSLGVFRFSVPFPTG
jgi:hypothetical protein